VLRSPLPYISYRPYDISTLTYLYISYIQYLRYICKSIRKKFIPAIKSHIQKEGGNIKEDVEEKECRVWYLDSQRHGLNRNHNFFLRMREEQNRYDITLKCRHPDRYISASYDLSYPADYQSN
jgi:hypothetical protein